MVEQVGDVRDDPFSRLRDGPEWPFGTTLSRPPPNRTSPRMPIAATWHRSNPRSGCGLTGGRGARRRCSAATTLTGGASSGSACGRAGALWFRVALCGCGAIAGRCASGRWGLTRMSHDRSPATRCPDGMHPARVDRSPHCAAVPPGWVSGWAAVGILRRPLCSSSTARVLPWSSGPNSPRLAPIPVT